MCGPQRIDRILKSREQEGRYYFILSCMHSLNRDILIPCCDLTVLNVLFLWASKSKIGLVQAYYWLRQRDDLSVQCSSQIHSGDQIREGCEPRPRSRIHSQYALHGFPWWLRGKNPPANAGDEGLLPGSGRPPGEGNGSPLQYSCLENPMDRGACWATVQGVTKESDMP